MVCLWNNEILHIYLVARKKSVNYFRDCNVKNVLSLSSGFTGARGANGDGGFPGLNGAPGDSGPTGPRGFPGDQGMDFFPLFIRVKQIYGIRTEPICISHVLNNFKCILYYVTQFTFCIKFR